MNSTQLMMNTNRLELSLPGRDLMHTRKESFTPDMLAYPKTGMTTDRSIFGQPTGPQTKENNTSLATTERAPKQFVFENSEANTS